MTAFSTLFRWHSDHRSNECDVAIRDKARAVAKIGHGRNYILSEDLQKADPMVVYLWAIRNILDDASDCAEQAHRFQTIMYKLGSESAQEIIEKHYEGDTDKLAIRTVEVYMKFTEDLKKLNEAQRAVYPDEDMIEQSYFSKMFIDLSSGADKRRHFYGDYVNSYLLALDADEFAQYQAEKICRESRKSVSASDIMARSMESRRKGLSSSPSRLMEIEESFMRYSSQYVPERRLKNA